MDESVVNETMGAQADETREGGRRRIHQEGEARGGGHGHRPHERQPGVEDMLAAGRVERRPAGTRPVRRHPPLHSARRDLHQAQGRRPRAVERAGHRHRRRLGRLQAPSEARRHRRQALRRPEVAPAVAARTRSRRCDPRHRRHPRGPRSRDPGGLPGHRDAAPHRANREPSAAAASCRSSPAGSHSSG